MVQATGLGRTDLILDYHTDQSQIRKKLNIPSDKKVILFVPTWKQDKKIEVKYPSISHKRNSLTTWKTLL